MKLITSNKQRPMPAPEACPLFTLIELLAVLAIIAILMSILLPSVSKAMKKAKETVCINNLRQLGLGVTNYYEDFDKRMPPWLSTMCRDYVTPQVFHCPMDGNEPSTLITNWVSHQHGASFADAFDRAGSIGLYGDHPNVDEVNKISYFYEFSEAQAPSWSGWNPSLSWNENKTSHLRYFNYNKTTFPVIRCTWHWKESLDAPYFNIAYAGNFFYSYAKWEDGTWTP